MKIKHLSVSIVIVSTLSWGVNSRAVTTQTEQILTGESVVQSQFQPVAFRDREEAEMLRRAYHILATGDHDYKGRRAKAMKEVATAGDLLGMDLHGGEKDHERQVLSDEKMREAKHLLERVLDAAEVKNEKRISRHIESAIAHIDKALEIK